MDRWFAPTNRLRTEGTDHLLAAAEATGVRPRRRAELRQLERDPRGRLGEDRGRPARPAHGDGRARAVGGHPAPRGRGARARAARHSATASLYGPGATDDQVELVRKRQYPLVGDGAGHSSWLHLDDAASATVLAVEQNATGVFNIVDDEPAAASDWLPYLAASARARSRRCAFRLGRGTARRRRRGDHDDRGSRVLQREGQAGARLGTPLPVVAQGFKEGLA